MPLIDIPAGAQLDEEPASAGGGRLTTVPLGATFDAPPDNSGFFGPFARVAGGLAQGLGAAMQKTSPVVQQIGGKMNYQPLGEAGPLDSGGVGWIDQSGMHQIDPTQHVVLNDPTTGKPTVYRRSAETDESGLMSLGRLAGFGAIAPSNVPAASTAAAANRALTTRFGSADTKAQSYLGNALRADTEAGGPGPQEIVSALAKSPETAVVDVAGENLRGLGGQVARMPGAGRQQMTEFLNGRDALAGGRLAEATNNMAADGPGTFLASRALHEQSKAAADPLYGKAYMVPPLHSERLEQFTKDPILKQGLAQGIEIQRLEDLAAGKPASPGGYSVEWDLDGVPNFASSGSKAQSGTPRKPQDIVAFLLSKGGVQDQAGELSAMDMHLPNKGYFGRLANSKGMELDYAREAAEEAGYLPRGSEINTLLDAIYDTTHGRAVYSTRDLDAVADYEHYFKTGQAPTASAAPSGKAGTFAVGGPLDPNDVLKDAPRGWNMQTLQAAKKGLDDILEGYRDSTTGRLVLDTRGRAVDQVRRAFLDEVDKLNPAYAEARAAYAGPQQSRGALQRGAQALNRDPDEIASEIASMSPNEQQFYRLGAANALKTGLAKTSSGGDEARQLIGNAYRQKQLQAVFPNADKLIDVARTENQMFGTRQSLLGGSQTAARVAQDASDGSSGILRPLAEAITAAATHEPVLAAKSGLGAIQAWLKSGKMTPEVAGKIAEYLLSSDPQTARAWTMNAFERGGPAKSQVRPLTPLVDLSAQQVPMIGEYGRRR